MHDPTPNDSYSAFIASRMQLGGDHGFAPAFLPPTLRDFQAALVEWSCRKGRAALLTECGTGKSVMQLAWARNVHERTGRPVLILTPLAVAPQLVREGEKFGIEAMRSRRGEVSAPIVVANYERLHLFDPERFGGLACDESSILKSFDGDTRRRVTEFARRLPYRLMATATAAPNDFIELGTQAEVLGELGYQDMLSRFFVNDQNTNDPRRNWVGGTRWRFKGHAEEAFWRWVASWARALRRPSDLGFSDHGFDLPPPVYREHVVKARTTRPGWLFDVPAQGLREEREERRRTIAERCEIAAALVADTEEPATVWCHLNDEGDRLEKLIPGAVQVAGSDSDDAKEEKFAAFLSGQARVLVSKPKIGAWGLNLQHCAHVVTFPSHSWEQRYQSVRRCWRYGQTRTVVVDTVATEGEVGVLESLRRKERQADRMFAALMRHMRDGMAVRRGQEYAAAIEVPGWLAADAAEAAA